MMELTESQKVILAAVAAEAGCEPSSLEGVLAHVSLLKQGYHAGRRMLFTALGTVPPVWIDAAIDTLMSRRPKKG